MAQPQIRHNKLNRRAFCKTEPVVVAQSHPLDLEGSTQVQRGAPWHGEATSAVHGCPIDGQGQ